MLKTRRVIGVALLAVLLAQWAALWHAVSHGPVPSAGLVHRAAAGAEQRHRRDADQASRPDHSGHAAGSPVCLLWDHSLQGQATETACLPAGPAQWASEAPHAQPALATPSKAIAAYEARGPPPA